jgi:hypothetical protein
MVLPEDDGCLILVTEVGNILDADDDAVSVRPTSAHALQLL